MDAINSRGVAGIAELGAGWYGREQHESHTWSWATRRGTVRLDAWPRSGATIELRFHLRALEPCTVGVRQDGRELARLAVGRTLSAHAVPVRVDAGRAEIEFFTTDPPTAESASPGARQLGFALYDLRLAVP
jgi:hypothetical protein